MKDGGDSSEDPLDEQFIAAVQVSGRLILNAHLGPVREPDRVGRRGSNLPGARSRERITRRRLAYNHPGVIVHAVHS